MSIAPDSGVQRTTTDLPPSAGRDSSQYRYPALKKISPSPNEESAMKSEVSGEDQEPYGASRIVCLSIGMFLFTSVSIMGSPTVAAVIGGNQVVVAAAAIC
jgi:hypothetical protein